MPDLEKVIRGLECCTGIEPCASCPYNEEDSAVLCDQLLMTDALVELREQEPVKPETVVRTGISECPTIQALVCGNCHKIMGYAVCYNYCPWCGRAVKWDD